MISPVDQGQIMPTAKPSRQVNGQSGGPHISLAIARSEGRARASSVGVRLAELTVHTARVLSTIRRGWTE